VKQARALCSLHGVSYSTTAALFVAALDLKEVQLLRGAIRVADEEAGPQHRFLDDDSYTPSAVRPCSPCYGPSVTLPRQVFHPTPRYEPRPVLHPTVRLEMRRTMEPAPVPIQPPVHNEPNPIQPPWKVLPSPILPVRLVKVVQVQPENNNTGRVIDCFI
jgi:hypothetical protein